MAKLLWYEICSFHIVKRRKSQIMRNIVLKVSAGLALLVCAGVVFSENASAVTILPNPGSTFDGIPVAIPYDSFFSYSAKLLTAWGFPGFDTPAGTGGLDVLLMTGAGGADNDPVSGGFVFEDPAPSVTGSMHPTFTDTWGAGLRPNGPVLVDTLLGYLHNQFGPTASIPVFTFDMNQTGSDPDLHLVAKFSIFDPVSSTEIASWSLDTIANGTFDPSAYVLAPGVISVTGTSLTTYTVDNNKGSGKNDFLEFAPTMNLSLYAGKGYEFHVYSHMIDLNDGFEESFISGAFTPPPNPPQTPMIPEPSSLFLFGMSGLTLLGPSFRRTRQRI